MSITQLLTIVSLVAGLVGLTHTLVRILIWTGRTMIKLGQLAEDLIEEPSRPGHPGRPGVLARLEAIEHRLERLDVLEERVTALERAALNALEALSQAAAQEPHHRRRVEAHGQIGPDVIAVDP